MHKIGSYIICELRGVYGFKLTCKFTYFLRTAKIFNRKITNYYKSGLICGFLLLIVTLMTYVLTGCRRGLCQVVRRGSGP